MKQAATAQAALGYLGHGWSVIPVRPKDKRPLTRWQDYQSDAASEADVKQWFDRWPDANVGIVTGRVSGLVVVDVDPKHRGDRSLTRLELEHGPLPPTIESTTGGGGRHIYFAHPGGIIHNKVGFAPGVDVRGDGGYVVAPPSLHASGKRYTWRRSHAPEQTVLAAMPRWLLDAISGDDQRVGHSIGYWRNLVREGVAEGERNNTIASLTGHLLWHGVDPDVTLELLLCWNAVRCQPPLPDGELVRAVQSITRLHERHREDADD